MEYKLTNGIVEIWLYCERGKIIDVCHSYRYLFGKSVYQAVKYMQKWELNGKQWESIKLNLNTVVFPMPTQVLSLVGQNIPLTEKERNYYVQEHTLPTNRQVSKRSIRRTHGSSDK